MKGSMRIDAIRTEGYPSSARHFSNRENSVIADGVAQLIQDEMPCILGRTQSSCCSTLLKFRCHRHICVTTSIEGSKRLCLACFLPINTLPPCNCINASHSEV